MVKLAIVDKDMNRVIHGFDTLDDARAYMKQYVITPAKDYIAALEEVSTLHIDKIGRKKKHIYHREQYDLITGFHYYALIHKEVFIVGGAIVEKGEEGYSELPMNYYHAEVY
jgi:hypothetical protein